MIIWFATGNAHKKQELAAILAAAVPGLAVKIPQEAGIMGFDPGETGSSFYENALIKARELRRLLDAKGLAGPVIADDSGLCVEALGGRPGILSARYGGGDGGKISAAERNALLLAEIGEKRPRNARFVCAMVLLCGADRFYLVQETLEGEIIGRGEAGRGCGGFGYDPIFYLPGQGKTVAELSEEEKNLISHRGRAGKAIAGLLELSCQN
jgi:XTP/dITP diphosphohydrolase